MNIQGTAHIEYHCADAEQASADLVTGFGFSRDPQQPAEPAGTRTVHLSQGDIDRKSVV